MSIGDDLYASLKNRNGVQVDEQEIERWVKEAGERMSAVSKSQKKFDMTFTCSGNRIVVGTFNRHADGRYSVEAYVCEVVRHGRAYADAPVAQQNGTPVPQQNSSFCQCASPKLKRVDISSSLGYDFCETCKKEKK